MSAAAVFVGLAARGDGLVAPLGRGLDVLLVIALEQAQVADRLGDRGLGVGDVVREVSDELVEHLLRVLGGVEHRVDVRLQEGRDAAKD